MTKEKLENKLYRRYSSETLKKASLYFNLDITNKSKAREYAELLSKNVTLDDITSNIDKIQSIEYKYEINEPKRSKLTLPISLAIVSIILAIIFAYATQQRDTEILSDLDYLKKLHPKATIDQLESIREIVYQILDESNSSKLHGNDTFSETYKQFEDGNIKGAIQSIKRYVEKNEVQLTEAYILQSKLHLANFEYKEATEMYSKLENTNASTDQLKDIARAFLQVGLLTTADKIFERIISELESNPNLYSDEYKSDIYAVSGVVKMRLGENELGGNRTMMSSQLLTKGSTDFQSTVTNQINLANYYCNKGFDILTVRTLRETYNLLQESFDPNNQDHLSSMVHVTSNLSNMYTDKILKLDSAMYFNLISEKYFVSKGVEYALEHFSEQMITNRIIRARIYENQNKTDSSFLHINIALEVV